MTTRKHSDRFPQLAVALDVDSAASISQWITRLPAAVRWYKIGLELFAAEGPRALAPLHDAGKSIFLDLKLHDIPRTVARAVKAAAAHRVAMLTVHASGGSAMLKAAAEAAAECRDRPLLVAVTTLTSLDQNDLSDLGIQRALADHTRALATLALSCGIDGVVCSPLEAEALRAALGPRAILVTPGVRLADDALGDQKRVATPAMAVRAGSNILVVGRPILEAGDPAAAAQRILRNMNDKDDR